MFKKILVSLLLLVCSTAQAYYGTAGVGQPVSDAGPKWMYEQAADPSALADEGVLYTKDSGGVSLLYYMDSAGTVTNLVGIGGLVGPVFFADDVTARWGNTAAAPDATLRWNTAQAVDAFYLGLPAAQNVFIIAENADAAYDFAHGAQTNPTLFIQSANQSATEFAKLNAGDLSFGLGIAVVATDYSIGRDADGTNQLHFNVPTGAGYEFSVNDVAKSTVSTTGAYVQSSALALGVTPTAGLSAINTSVAADGVQQISSGLYFSGQGWKTDAAPASMPVDWMIYDLPIQGAATPQSKLIFTARINSGSWGDRLTLDTSANASTMTFPQATGVIRFGNGDNQRILYNTAGFSFDVGGVPRITFAPTATMYVKGASADGATAVGVVDDNTTALTTAGGKITSFRNATVEKAYVDKDGGMYNINGAFGLDSNDYISMTNNTQILFNVNGVTQAAFKTGSIIEVDNHVSRAATVAMTFKNYETDAADSIAYIFDTNTAFTTAGAKLISFRTGGVEKAYVDYLGSFNAGAGTALLPAYSFVGDPNSGFYSIGADNVGLALGGAVEVNFSTSAVSPGTDGGSALGTTALKWTNLFLASSGALNWNNGNVTIQHVTGGFDITSAASTGSNPTIWNIYQGTASTIPATEQNTTINFNFGAAKQWATGDITTQRDFVIQKGTYSFVGASVITNAATVAITGAPSAGLNATITNPLALWVQANPAQFDGGIIGKQGTDIASASTIVIPRDGNTFELTGTTAVTLITKTGYQDGFEITLIANENVTITNGTATAGSDITIKLAGAGNFAMTADDTLTLVLSTTTAGSQAWREKSRSAN